jgi:thiamine-monophosphate kinase
MVKLSELGEFGLIDRFSRRFLQKLPAGVVGIGDDCAVIPQNEQTSLLVTTDALVENIHFLRSAIRPEDLGYKALAVNLSDIAAMGGTPSHIFLSLAIPKECEVEWLDQFFEGFYGLAQSESVTVLGGDTTQSPGPFVINVTLLGTARTEFVKFRSTAQVGDWVCVTGYLGDSSGGLRSLLEDRPADEDIRRLREAHHRPRPHLAEGKWLASQSGVHAMMDISDGIDSDLRRIMEQSNQGVRIDLEKLPRSPSLKNASALYQWNDVELAAT